MNLLFLGIEGVLSKGALPPVAEGELPRLNPATVSFLEDICREADAAVVLCAKERTTKADTEWWNRFFKDQGTRHVRVIGMTPVIEEAPRGFEVLTFLKNFQEEVSNYVVLDATGEYLVWQPRIPVKAGLSAHEAYEALRQLNPKSRLLESWDDEYGFGDLLTLTERPQRRAS